MAAFAKGKRGKARAGVPLATVADAYFAQPSCPTALGHVVPLPRVALPLVILHLEFVPY